MIKTSFLLVSALYVLLSTALAAETPCQGTYQVVLNPNGPYKEFSIVIGQTSKWIRTSLYNSADDCDAQAYPPCPEDWHTRTEEIEIHPVCNQNALGYYDFEAIIPIHALVYDRLSWSRDPKDRYGYFHEDRFYRCEFRRDVALCVALEKSSVNERVWFPVAFR